MAPEPQTEPEQQTEPKQQIEYARRLARMLNEGVLQDAVAVGLEEQGQFEIDTLDLLDALRSAGLTLTPGDVGDDPVA